MKRKFGCHSRSFFASSIDPIYNGGHRFLSAITIITVALLLFLPSHSLFFNVNVNADDFVAFASPSSMSQLDDTTTVTAPRPPLPQSPVLPSQSQSQENADLATDNFDLPAGYVIEPLLSNLSSPTSIAIDSSNGTLYVAESITEYENNSSNSSSNIRLASSSASPLSSPVSLISEQQQQQQPLLESLMRIVKANISGNSINNNIVADQSSNTNSSGGINVDNDTTIVVDNVLNWPVIDMEVDDTSGLIYALHDHATVSRINTTSGEREDILVTEEEQEQETATAVSTNEYEEELQDPLSVLINSSGQIVLSGKQDNYDNMDGEEEAEQEEGQEQVGNYDSHYSTVLYTPCINGDIDDYGRYCILSLPIDSNGNSAVIENISGVTSPSLILENMTSRPIGIAILNSSHLAASSSSSISEQQAQRSYASVSSETSSNSFGNNNNYTELLVIGSQPTNNNSISALSTIYHIKVSGSIPYPGIASNNNNSNNNPGSNSNQNPQLQQALPTTSVESLVDYPDGQLGKVAVVSVPPVTSSSSVNDNESSETNPAASSGEDDEDTSSFPPFGLNKTTAFIIDFGNNSSASSAALPQQLPKIIMLDVETGSVTPFLTFNSPTTPNFMPIDIAFDYDNRALYVLSSISNQEEQADITNDITSSNNLLNTDTRSNNSGLIWKISYQGPEQEEAAETSNNSTSISNGTDNDNNATSELTTPPPPPPPSSSNGTDSSSNSSDSIDTDDDSIDTDDGNSGSSNEDTDDGNSGSSNEDTDDGNSGSSNEDTDDGNSDGGGNSSPPETTPPPPVNNPPIAQVDVATTDQDTPVVIDVLANDVDSDGDSLIIDSVDEESIQGGNVRVISGGDTNDEDNNSESNVNERIEYTPAGGFIGSDEFTYNISDGNGAIDSATVTITVNQVVIAPHPISYWLENENGITQGLLERAAEEHDSYSDDEEQEEWSFNLGNFRVPVEFDVSGSENDTRGILEAGQGSNNDDEEDDSADVYDQLAAQLLAAKLNIGNGVSTCEPIVTTIGYTDIVLRDSLYNGPGSTENTTDESSRDYAFELIEILDTYNNNGCV